MWSELQGSPQSVIRIKCRTYLQAQKGIEKLYTVKANIESTLTQMALQKGMEVWSVYHAIAKMIEALAMQKGTYVLKDMTVYLILANVTV